MKAEIRAAAEADLWRIAEFQTACWVFDDNLAAQRCYLRLGFADDGGRQIDPDTGLGESRWVRPGPDRVGRGD